MRQWVREAKREVGSRWGVEFEVGWRMARHGDMENKKEETEAGQYEFVPWDDGCDGMWFSLSPARCRCT